MKYVGLILSVILSGYIFWSPVDFLGQQGKVPAWQAVLLVWSVCATIVAVFDLQPSNGYLRFFFCPLLTGMIIAIFLFYFLNENYFHL